MKSCKSLVTANKVLEKLENSKALTECWYHSVHSGGMDSNGHCGYMLYAKCAQKTIKINFYGTNKETDTPIRIFILADGKSKIRGKQFKIDDAIKFIEDKVTQFMKKSKNG